MLLQVFNSMSCLGGNKDNMVFNQKKIKVFNWYGLKACMRRNFVSPSYRKIRNERACKKKGRKLIAREKKSL